MSEIGTGGKGVIGRVLGGVIGRVIGAGGVGGSVVDSDLGVIPKWHEIGSPVVAYQPLGASDYSDSKINLANPGTHNAADVDAPTWDSTYGIRGAGNQEWEVGSVSDFSFIQNTAVFSIVCRVRLSNANSGALNNILGNTVTATERGVWFAIDDRAAQGNGAVRMFVARGALYAPLFSILVDNQINDTNWHTVAARADGSDCFAYVDGSQIGSDTRIHPLSTGDPTRVLEILDSAYTSDFGFQGDLASVGIWDRDLGDADIKNVMSKMAAL